MFKLLCCVQCCFSLTRPGPKSGLLLLPTMSRHPKCFLSICLRSQEGREKGPRDGSRLGEEQDVNCTPGAAET